MDFLRKFTYMLVALFVFTALSTAQKPAPQPPPQTARQAILEIVKGGREEWVKHLTVEVQQLLSEPENSSMLASFGSAGFLRGQAGTVQTFETGPVLFSLDDPKEQAKLEVRVENDDLNGDEDTLELSLHRTGEGQEQPLEEPANFISRLGVTMVRQQNVWRVSKIGVGVELRFGDPEFLKTLFPKSPRGVAAGAKVGSEAHAELKAMESTRPAELPPSQMLNMLAFAEHAYAGEHPELGFTCSLSDLAEAGKSFMVNPQVAAGVYGSYKINVTGCQGKPSGSFQITLEPTAPAAGSKAFCTDATQNVRISDDGRGATCLASGRPEENAVDQGGIVGFDVTSTGANTPKK